MGQRMNWSRAKKPRAPAQSRTVNRLEREADKILEAPMSFHEHEHATAERSYYRSIGSVLSREGRWIALGADGKELGEFTTRLAAWAHADKCGMERVGALP